MNIAHVTLHVGLGTFRPVKVDDVEQHHMHSEFYVVEEDQARLINDTKKRRACDFRRDHKLSDAGVCHGRRRDPASRKRMDGHIYISGIPF